ncbi:MAG: hypothetical protein JAY63_00010 [Candidatus Thiodiazotropha taylori]|nr:hypothetical protein [Candidatus Thiodiazotropha taylori]
MADYYFCNGTTQRNTPCQNHVSSEGDRCRHHGGGGGPGKMLSSAYKAGKVALDAICYLYACSDAVPYAIELASKGLGVFSKLLSFFETDDPNMVRQKFIDQERLVESKLATMDAQELREYSALCNHLVALVREEKYEEQVVYRTM